MEFDTQSTQKRYTGMFALAGRFGYFYPSANTIIEIKIGTIATDHNCAEITGDSTGLQMGHHCFRSFGLDLIKMPPPSSQETAPKAPTPPPTASAPAHDYPNPHVITINQQISGSLLDGPRYSDVAVLSILLFERRFPIQSQTVVQTLISDTRVAWMTKITTDLFGNGGGDILLGYDLFR